MMTPDEDLMQVTLFALENDVFRQAWETAVREVADRVTAVIAGRRMAGEGSGSVEADLEGTELPLVASIGPERTQAVFARAVTGEVGRRIEAMISPGSFG